ncbi:MAG: flagellar basal body-associated FliL family protein [Chloroflexi bacterium]|nr:flagellar basal body-associated FliL family protein [Chloroflexota bacterium]
MPDKKILAGGAVLFGAAFWFYIKPNYLESPPPPVYTEEQLAEAPRPTLTLEERVINLKSPTTSPNYAKVTIAFEFADPDHKYIGAKGAGLEAKNEVFAEEMKPELHRIWDVVTNVMGKKTIEQVASSEGKEQLKTELIAALNKELHEEKVEGVFFVSFITQ